MTQTSLGVISVVLANPLRFTTRDNEVCRAFCSTQETLVGVYPRYLIVDNANSAPS